MPPNRETYWRDRALAAEALLEVEHSSVENPGSQRTSGSDYYIGPDSISAQHRLSALRIRENETLNEVVIRVEGYLRDRMTTMNHLRRAGYSVTDDPQIETVTTPLVDGLLKDLTSGRQTIEFLAQPPKLRADALPIGSVFTHRGDLYEIKREPTGRESTIVCYVWNRDDASKPVDRAELVSPLGRVTYDHHRKSIKLGLLEISQSAEQHRESDDALFSAPPAPRLLPEKG